MLDRPLQRDVSTKVPAPSIAPLLNEFNPATAFAEFWQTSAFQLTGQVAQSWLHFLGERWLNDIRFPQQLAACQTADDLQVAVSEFWQQAYRDYSAEFGQLSNLTWAGMRTNLGSACALSANDSAQCCGKCSS
jgi:hypothetical protein